MKVLGDELVNYQPISNLNYSIRCSCNAMTSLQVCTYQDYLIRFLKGLNEKFNATKSQIMLMTPFQTIDTTFSTTIKQERCFSLPLIDAFSTNNSDNPSIYASLMENASQTKQKWKWTGPSRGTNRDCTHCGRMDHIFDTCFVKHGYPNGFKTKGKTP